MYLKTKIVLPFPIVSESREDKSTACGFQCWLFKKCQFLHHNDNADTLATAILPVFSEKS